MILQKRRIGILGGTFNPIHLGHIQVAQEVQQILELDKVLFIPARTPPLKGETNLLNKDLRLELVKAATLEHPAFQASDIEMARIGPSYTVETLEALLHLNKWNPEELYFLMGYDAFMGLESWHRYGEILRLTNLVVMTRPGFPVVLSEISRIVGATKFCYNGLTDKCRYLTQGSSLKESEHGKKSPHTRITPSKPDGGVIRSSPALFSAADNFGQTSDDQ
ncbi:MAG: nicotinate (nicotinamide) nucleotide adenylyltransferase, partial [Bdellovibrionales bacterium]|nr:nicotinate (nicotinamide) nucleotide adenylyltransferase [Bdellovibrionales bacterium]